MVWLSMGFASSFPVRSAKAIDEPPTPKERTYEDRTDSVEAKLGWVMDAYRRGDLRLVRGLLDSLRQTVGFEAQQTATLGKPGSPSSDFIAAPALPAAWRDWARGWRFVKVLEVVETAGEARRGEPVECVLAVPAGDVVSLEREVRVVRLDGGALREVRSQVTEEARRGQERHARLTWFVDSEPSEVTRWLVFYGNPDAELPQYSSDLVVRGEGVGLEIDTMHFRASLSRQMGQLERLVYKREHGLELFSGGDGHGEPPGIDWAHDYVGSGNFQKFRVTNWPECPEYEVVRGPLSVVVRRWGFPYSPIHPVYTPARIHVYVEYRFYAGTPWFLKTGTMQVIRDTEIGYLRDDEWVFSGMSFTDGLWMDRDGRLHEGAVPTGQAGDLWGVGFFHRQTRDAFVGLFLDHSGDGTPPLEHTGAPILHYRWHGHVWSRAMFHGATLKAGAVLRQRNAYLTLPYGERDGARGVEALGRQLRHPLEVRSGTLGSSGPDTRLTGRLARPGEAGDAAVSKRLLWEALAECRDEQLYAARPSIVELGLVDDIRVRGDVVQVLLTMPSRGRPRAGFFAHGSGGNEHPIRDLLLRVPGVREVIVEQRREPEWSVHRLTEAGREKLGLPR